MCILLKLHYVKFDVSRLFCSKVIEEKPLGVGSNPPPLGKGRVNFLRIFCKCSFEFGKILLHPREFNHHFPQVRQLDEKIARVAGIRSLKKFSRGLLGGVSSWN